MQPARSRIILATLIANAAACTALAAVSVAGALRCGRAPSARRRLPARQGSRGWRAAPGGEPVSPGATVYRGRSTTSRTSPERDVVQSFTTDGGVDGMAVPEVKRTSGWWRTCLSRLEFDGAVV